MKRDHLHDSAREIEALQRHIVAADRLISSAGQALTEFHVTGKGNGFRGFARDTLQDSGSEPLSTGGTKVTAELWALSPLFPYLKAAVGEEPFSTLSLQRDAATSWLNDKRNRIKLSTTFGSLSPLIAAHLALPLSHAPLTTRGAAFGAVVLHALADGWPQLPNVEHPHPFVASHVFRAGNSIFEQGRWDDVLATKPSRIAYRTAVDGAAQLGGLVSSVAKRGIDHEAATSTYTQEAIQYLWRQCGLASGGSPTSPAALNYDPVGACFALDILVSSALGAEESKGSRRLGSHGDLIHASIKHILGGMSQTGSLAYGLPFTYNPKGMGAFATSTAGLAALTRAVAALLEKSRHGFYSNGEWIGELIDDNAVAFDKLFALPSILEGSKRTVLSERGVISGWSTDRAPSVTRVESWVTVDVFVFAAHLRLLAQEIAQFIVVRKFGGAQALGEPRWPYEPSTEPLRVVAGGMQDPDEQASSTKQEHSRSVAPVQVLHDELQLLMAPNSDVWRVRKSSFLLFGPPGTAKSTIAKSLAARLGWHFVELTPSNFVELGLEMIERRAKDIFEGLGLLRETVILFDELDSLLTDRESLDKGSILNFSVPAMLPKLQKLKKLASRQRLVLLFATNFYDRLDPALVRRGRVDERLLVLPHNAAARRRLLEQHFKGKDLKQAVTETALCVYEDLIRYVDLKKANLSTTNSIAGIVPTLYSSRIPVSNHRGISSRATERLAIEICEVIGRLLDQERTLSADSSRADISARIEVLSRELSASAAADKRPWSELCVDISDALRRTPEQTS